MTRTQWIRAGAVVALLGGFSILSLPAQDKPTVDSITKMADDVSKKDWAELSKDGAEAAKKHELLDVMNLFKLRRPPPKPGEKAPVNGIGIGPVQGAISPDGVEAKIQSLTKKEIGQNQLNKEQPHLIRMTEITASIAATSIHQCPVDKKMGCKDPANWKKWMEEMYKSSQDLNKAIKDKKPADIKKAATALEDTCRKCHSDFRDNSGG
jgi:hypothetical protein